MAATEFDSEQLEKRLHNLKDSQDSIQSLSTWCLERRSHHKKIVATWLQVLKKVKVEHRLVLFYLANDVIQYSKRKNYEFVESWGTTLQRATTLVRDEKVKHRILRIFKIWDQRQVYDEEFLTDLSDLISAAPKKKPEPAPVNITEEFQPTLLITLMRSCSTLEQTTDSRLREMRESNIDIDNAEELCASLKDRRRVEDAERDVDLAVKNVENYINALEAEIRQRTQVLDLLDQADQFYETQRGEVKIVTNAYRNFGSRVKNLKKKLDELLPTLISPIPSPDVNAPSPSPDSDIELPDDQTMEVAPPSMYGSYSLDYDPMPVQAPDNSTDFANSFTSFMGTNVDFDMRSIFTDRSATPIGDQSYNEAMPIEVINMRPSKTGEEFTSSFIKPVLPAADRAPSSGGIPGLGLDVPEPRTKSPQRPDYSANHHMSHNTATYANQNSQNNAGMSFDGSSTNSVNPLPPPPLPPPIFLDDDGCYNKLPPKFPTWTPANEGKNNMNSTWTDENADSNRWESRNDVNWSNGIRGKIGLSETPESPPIYEKSSFRDPVQYNDSQTQEPILSSASDVDHRVIPLPMPAESHLPHRLMKGADVDHRNLISLTGSPANSAANTNESSQSNSTTLWSNTDQDYRQIQQGDNVESVDMEMSDEETDGSKQKSRVLVDLRSQDRDMRSGQRHIDLDMRVASLAPGAGHGQIIIPDNPGPLSSPMPPFRHPSTDFPQEFHRNPDELFGQNFRPNIPPAAFMQNQSEFPIQHSEIYTEFHDDLTLRGRYPLPQEHPHQHYRDSPGFHRGRGRGYSRNRRDRFSENSGSRRHRGSEQLENPTSEQTNNRTGLLQPPETCVILDDNGLPIMPDTAQDDAPVPGVEINPESQERTSPNETEKPKVDGATTTTTTTTELGDTEEIASEDRSQEEFVARADEPPRNLSEHLEALMNSGKTTGVNELKRQSTNGSVTEQQQDETELLSPQKKRPHLQNGPLLPSPHELHPAIIYDYDSQHVTSPNFRARLPSQVSPISPSNFPPWRGAAHQPRGRGSFRGSPRTGWVDRGGRGGVSGSPNFIPRGNKWGNSFRGTGNNSSGFRGRGRGTGTW